MFRKIVTLILILLFLTAFSTAFGMTKSDKNIARAGAGLTGKVTAVKGRTITVRDSKGIERQFDLNSAAGIKIGQNAWCEEDCGKGMRVGDKNVQVQGARQQ